MTDNTTPADTRATTGAPTPLTHDDVRHFVAAPTPPYGTSYATAHGVTIVAGVNCGDWHHRVIGYASPGIGALRAVIAKDGRLYYADTFAGYEGVIG